jgi:hypothetical protein
MPIDGERDSVLSVSAPDPQASEVRHRGSASTMIRAGGDGDGSPGGPQAVVSRLGHLFPVVEVGEPLKTRRHTARATRERQREAHRIGLSSRILAADLQAWPARLATASHAGSRRRTH